MADSCQAVLVRRYRWSESSLIVVWLTDGFGTVRTSARGALRAGGPFTGKLDLFTLADISLAPARRGSLHALREVVVRAPFRGRTYPALAVASYFAELSAAVAPEMQPAAEILDLLVRGLDHIGTRPASLRAIAHFEAELARLLGVFDASGRTAPSAALAQLCGGFPRCRQAALEAV